MEDAELRWKMFLQGKVPHPEKFEQHLLIFDLVDSTNIPNLPINFNRFMTGAVTLDIVGSKKSLMTFAKMGKFTVFGIIQKGPNKWEGTKIHVKSGLLRPRKFVIPAGLLDLFRQKADHSASSMAQLSKMQREKIDKNILGNLDAFLRSDQFAAINADAVMFGEQAVLWKDET
ncbi:MAG: hypothetical protein A3D16_02855 [Rhodobacterales bacterium RIFCSPHIGHO2_02_FULL_62_130]|nr:MAG: hypothetical protein A3D16_02855 [Rhodobacterales bacterium RIFCSPHIGHO2_02_FULL_62_130]OHC55884.1 MAG: hypothetical protein A3E48_08225 [Rhodobacterales bacterium RIFCSPHIGHO2_12_FULL_62_75]HCZ00027.1 hypothetical protein [Rhodobacter sp.]